MTKGHLSWPQRWFEFVVQGPQSQCQDYLQLLMTKDTIFDSRGGVEGQEFLKKMWNPLLYTWATWFLPILRLGCVKKSNFLRYQNFATFFTCHFCFGFCSPRLSFLNKYAKYAPFWKAEILIFQVQVDLGPQQPSKFFYLKQKF